MTGTAEVVIGLLLVAGLPRLVGGSPAQRALATALCASAVALVLELDPVERALAGSAALLQCLCVTLAAAAAYAMARHVSPAPLHPRVAPAAVAVPVAALQCALFALVRWVDGVLVEPPTASLFLDHADRPAVVALWAVTAAGPVAAGVVLLPVLRTYGPGLARLRSQVAVACTVAGLVVLAVAGAVMAAQVALAAVDRPEVGRLAVSSGPLIPIGLAVVAVGVLVSRAATALAPLGRWTSAHIALRRLRGLAHDLAAAAPEWAVSTVADRWSLRNPAGQLYRRVIAIRDASWTLLGLVDDEVIARAVAFARSRVGFAGDEAVGALAEACCLRYAVDARRSGVAAPPAPAAQFPERIAEPAGSLRDEAAFLTAVSRAWRHPLVEEFLDCPRDDDCRRHLRTA